MSALDGLFGVRRILVGGVEATFRQTLNLLGGWSVAEGVDAFGAPTIELTPPTGGGGSSSLDWKDSVRAATAAALPASTRVGSVRTANANGALPSVDGVALAINDDLLDKDHATGADRGIWRVTALGSGAAPWVLTRRSDFDVSAEVTSGARIPVSPGGTANGGKVFKLDTLDPITLNTTSLTFSLDSSATVAAGNGLQGTTTLSVKNNGATVDVSASGVKVADGGIGNTQLATGLSWSKLATAIGNLAFSGLKSLMYNGEVSAAGATPSVNFTAGDCQKTTLTANCTPTFVAPAAGVGWVQWHVVQDTTPRTITFPGSVVGNPPQPATGSGTHTFYLFFYDGTNYIYPSADPSAAFALVDGSRAFTGGVTMQTSLALGDTNSTHMASAGIVRLAPGSGIKSRAFAFDIDLDVYTSGTSDNAQTFGSSLSSVVNISGPSGGGVNLYAGGVSRWSVNATAQNWLVPAAIVGAVAGASGFTQSITNISSGASAGGFWRVRAMGTTSGNTNGAHVELEGGRRSGTGVSGGVKLKLNADDTQAAMSVMLEAREITQAQRVLSLLFPGTSGAGVTATQLPTNTGDLVIFIGNCATAPTANPVGGGLLYVEAGALKYRGSGSTVTILGPA